MSDYIPLAWDLPWHLLVDILGRIPVESLARCSCVATSWREVTNQESSLKRKIDLERGERDLSGWDISTWRKLFHVRIFDSAIWSIADLGDNVAIGGELGHLQIWKKGVWELVGSLQGHRRDVNCLLPQPRNLLISGSSDETVRIWNLVDKACVRVIRGQKHGVLFMSVSDGLIFCGSDDDNIRSWELESGDHVQTFQGHTSCVTSVVVKEGRMFTGSEDKTIKIWDITKGESVRSFDCSQNLDEELWVNVVWVDDEKLVAVRGNGEIWEWDFSQGL
ncbi:hypothetical protein BSKO_02804 [Bryopsis sp. KO-2023]|nr:hypothetical protein BSKO_02804 [Bryopsis sp. KO-2023]